MQTDNRLLDDLARMANGAINALSGVREEIETRVRERVERALADMDMVPREEFDAVKAMAQKARAEQEELAVRLAAVEQRLNQLAVVERRLDELAATAPQKRATRSRTTKTGAAAKPKSGE